MCDEFSGDVSGVTMDGISSAPPNLTMQCTYNEITHESTVHATWNNPEDPQGKITEYDVNLSGNASYYDEHGRHAEDKFGPVKKTVLANQPKRIDFRNQPPNTRLYLRYAADN